MEGASKIDQKTPICYNLQNLTQYEDKIKQSEYLYRQILEIKDSESRLSSMNRSLIMARHKDFMRTLKSEELILALKILERKFSEGVYLKNKRISELMRQMRDLEEQSLVSNQTQFLSLNELLYKFSDDLKGMNGMFHVCY